MMKSNSLKNRLLALALTLVMVLGMLPSDFVSAEDAAPAEPDSTVVTDGNVWLIDDTYYATLQAAVDAASAEGQTTIKLAGNAFGPGAVVNGSKNIVIDFNSKTYSLTEPVGSTGTESNGLQLLAGSTVTLMNGTLQVAEANKYDFYILVQNYGNLNVSSMILDGTNLDKWSGSDGDSYALSINSGEVAIDGSTIKANNEGAYAYAFDVCEYGSYAAPSVTVYSGSIEGKIDTSAIGGSALSIKGGSFTVPASVTKYVAAGYKMNSSGAVTKAAAVWQVGEDTYTTLQEAVDAAPAGGTITLLGNASGAGAVVNKSVTIDFGGYTYSLVEPVGSTGTKSNGLQLLTGNDVTLKNGTLEAAARFSSEFYILVQNYANLTVSSMNLYGEGLDKYAFTDQDSYVLSINSGKVLIENTNIYANTTGSLAYAFDVCKYGSYAAPQVTVTGGCFEGSIDTSSFKDNAPLTITGGTYTDIHTAEQHLADGYKLVISEEKGTVALDTIVTPLTGGEVEQLEDGTIVVAVENEINLAWSDPLGDSVGGWWAGIKVQAPVSLTADQLAKSTYTVNDSETEVFMDHIVSEEGETPYIEMWIKLNHEIIENDDDGVVTEKYVFNWAGEEQTVVFEIQTAKVNLIQDTDQDKLYFAQEEVNVVYDQNLVVPVETLHGGSGNGVVTYNITSEDGDEIVELVTAEDGTVSVAVKKVGTVTIQATKAASGPYALATATYTLTINPRPVTVYVNSCSKTYGEENPQFTYSLSEEGLDAYVTFVDISEDVIAGKYDLIVDEAYILENGDKSDNYEVTVENSEMIVTHADREVKFNTDKPEVVFGTTEYNNTFSYPAVGDQTVTYSIVKAEGIEASVNDKGIVSLGTTKVLEKDATVIVRVVVAEDDGYKECSATYTLTVKPMDLPSEQPYTIDGDTTTDGNWYTSDVALELLEELTEEFDIGLGSYENVPTVWSDSVTLTDQGANDYVVFLRSKDGFISAPISGSVNIDKTAPDISVSYKTVDVIECILEQLTFFYTAKNDVEVTLHAEDETSELVCLKYRYHSDAEYTVIELNPAEQEHTITFTIPADDRGKVEFVAVNAAGLDREYGENPDDQQYEFVLDNTPPEITGSYGGEYETIDQVDVDGKSYTNVPISEGSNFSTTLTVTDANIDLSRANKVIVTYNGQTEEIALGTNDQITLTLNKEGTYLITAQFVDVLGNKSEVYEHLYIVDKTAPEIIEGELEPANTDEKINYVDLRDDEKHGKIYTNNTDFTIPLTVNEKNFDVRKADPVVEISYRAPGATEFSKMETEGLNITWDLDEDGNGVADLKLSDLGLIEDGDYQITVTFSDRFKDDSYTVIVCVDDTPPDIYVTYHNNEYVDQDENRLYFDQNQTATIKVKENNFFTDNIVVEVLAKYYNGDDVFYDQENTIAEHFANYAKDPNNWTLAEDGSHELVLDFNIDANYTLKISYADPATNTDSYGPYEFTVDKVGPEDLKITYQTPVWQGVLDKLSFGMFYGNTTQVTISAKDTVSGIKEFNYAYKLGALANFNNAEMAELDLINATYDNAKGEFYATFDVPAKLEKTTQFNGYIMFNTSDWAGHIEECDSLDEVVGDGNDPVDYYVIVDNTKPIGTIHVTEPVKKTEDVAYYSGDIDISIEITESNFYFPNDVHIVVTKDGDTYTTYRQTEWVNNKKSLTLTEEGDYQISITYTDKSGNEMDPWTSGKLTLDTTAPVITVTNVKQNSANKDETYGFMITVTDINLDVDSVKPVLKAVVKGEDGMYKTQQIDLGKAQIDAEGETAQFTVENLPEDALYTLTCSAKDMSDNETTEILLADGKPYETVNFSINRNGSTFGFGNDFTEALVNQYYVYSVYEDVILVEVNVDPIENYTITVNGVELVEGTDYDYTTKQSSDPGEWSMNTYIISKDYFAKQGEGQYNIVVSSTDKANTTAYSDIKNLAVAFVVDQTAPVLTISGLQEGGRYQTTEQTVTLIPTDEGGSLNSLKILIMDSDGEPLTDDAGNDISVRFDLSGEELFAYLEENGGMVTFTIPTGLEMQVQIICNDCAVNAEGLTNEYNETFKRVTVSENAFIIFYANKPAFYGTISGVVVLAAAAVILIKRRKTAK